MDADRRRRVREIRARAGLVVGLAIACAGAPTRAAVAPVIGGDGAEVDRGARIDRAFTLAWSAAPACPGADAVTAAIRGILRETPPERLEGRSVAARAIVRRGDDGRFALALILEVDGAQSERAIDAASCAVLAEATALLIAMTIDPLAAPPAPKAPREADTPPSSSAGPDEPAAIVVDEAEAPPKTADEAEAPPKTADEAAPREGPAVAAPAARGRAPAGAGEDPPRPRRRLGVVLGVGLLGGSAGLGSFGLGAGATIGLGRGRWRIEATGAYWAPRGRSLADHGLPDARVDLRLGAAGLRGCGVPTFGRIEVPLCAGVEVGGMRGEGRGLEGARRYVGPWAAITASPGVLIRVGERVALGLRIDAALALSRPAFEVRGLGVVFQADAGSLAASLGIELRLPATR